jgi:hypothetical protein
MAERGVMAAHWPGESDWTLGKRWFSCFLTFFFLYLLADTFLLDGPFGSTVTFISLALALTFYFGGALGGSERNGGEADPDD